MIVDVFGKQVDTTWDHKQAEDIRGNAWCSKDRPQINFTVEVKGFTKYVNMVFNRDGTEMQEVHSWHPIPREDRMHKVLKSKAREGCYFSKREEKAEKEWVNEVDHSKPSYSPHVIHWKKGDKEPRIIPSSTESKPAKKRFGIF